VNISEAKFHFLDIAIDINFEHDFIKTTDAAFQAERKDNKPKFRLFCKKVLDFDLSENARMATSRWALCFDTLRSTAL
jgi:hypothetical protein